MLMWLIQQIAIELFMRVLLDWLGFQILMVFFLSRLRKLPFNAAELPDQAGIYIVASWFHVSYVGKATSFKRRWKKHHISQKIKLPWFLSFYLLPEEDELRRTKLEKLLIWCLAPKLNSVRFKEEQVVQSKARLMWQVLNY